MATMKYVEGVVGEWNDDEGFGTIDSPETPGGCAVIFFNVSIGTDGYRTLRVGQRVRFTFLKVHQDGRPFQAQNVVPLD